MALDHGRLLVATRNPGKLRELNALLADCPLELVSLSELGIEAEVDETGATLEDNASLKARGYALQSGLLTLADDSGLEVDALGGEPGPMSSRYAGRGGTDPERVSFLLGRLEAVPRGRRQARFRCVMALASPGEPPELFTSECEGVILAEPRGASGFGYDPVFYLPELGKTMAELTPEEKNRLSHRGIAARKVVARLRQARSAVPGDW